MKDVKKFCKDVELFCSRGYRLNTMAWMSPYPLLCFACAGDTARYDAVDKEGLSFQKYATKSDIRSNKVFEDTQSMI